MGKLLVPFTVAFCCFGSSLVATTTIPVDLGPPGIDHFIYVPFADLSGTHLNGQMLSLDFTFQSNEFIRLFSATKNFAISLDLVLGNPSPNSTPYSGTGYLINSLGAGISPPRSLVLTPGYLQGNLIIAGLVLFPSLTDAGSSASLLTPLDFYGVHFDLTLPTTTTTVITSSSHIAFSDAFGNSFGFGVGPGAPLPVDVVPETGTTLVLLTIAVCGILRVRRFKQGSLEP